MKFPTGLEEIRRVYGDPAPFVDKEGKVDEHKWQTILGNVWLPEPLPLGWNLERQVERIRVHHKLIAPLTFVFGEIHRNGWWYRLKTFDGSYAWRNSRGLDKLSTHCWGIAVDLNAATNRLGTVGNIHPDIVDVFETHGWTWGGRWKRPDPMHFQAASGY